MSTSVALPETVRNAFSVEGRVALITGASRNTGAVMAKVFAAGGAKVAAAGSRLSPDLEAVVSEINEAGGTAIAVPMDLEGESFTSALADIEKHLGPVDILINNAVDRVIKPLQDINVQEWDRNFNVNLRGPFLLSQALLPGMLERRFGRIINIAGTDATDYNPHSIAPCASNAGLLGLTRTLAARAASGAPERDSSEPKWPTIYVTVNAISPGGIETSAPPSGGSPDPEWLKNYFGRIPAGRRGQMEEFALVAVFLASPAAGYITGVTLPVSGGMVV